jgi:hypothetical protein
VGLDRAHAEVHLRGDLLVRVPEGDRPQDLALATGEVVVGARGEPRSERRVHVHRAVEGRADGLDELRVGGVLQHVGRGAPLERELGVGGLVLHREHHDARAIIDELRQDLERGAVAQPEVEHDHVGALLCAHGEGLVDRSRLADDLELLDLVEQAADPAADDGVVVHEDDPNRSFVHGHTVPRARPAPQPPQP